MSELDPVGPGNPDDDAPLGGELVPSVDAVSEERRAAALEAVNPDGNWITLSGYPTIGYRAPVQSVVNTAALSPELNRKIAALREEGLYELVDGIRVGKTAGPAAPVPLDHLTFGWRYLTEEGPSGAAMMRHQRYNPTVMFAINAMLYSLVFFAGLFAVVYLLRGSATPADGVLALAACAAVPGAAAGWFIPALTGGPAPDRRLTADERKQISDALVTIPGDSPEGRLARFAYDLAESITSAPAWTSEVLAAQRAGFDPQAIADQARTHAANIADLRAQVGAVSDGELPEEVAARASVEYEAKLLDGMVETLRYRVAGLWLYNESITELSKRVTAMTALEGSIARVQRLEGAAQQMGSDILAASELAARTADLDAVRAQVDILVQGLAATLGMTITPELPGTNTEDH